MLTSWAKSHEPPWPESEKGFAARRIKGERFPYKIFIGSNQDHQTCSSGANPEVSTMISHIQIIITLDSILSFTYNKIRSSVFALIMILSSSLDPFQQSIL